MFIRRAISQDTEAAIGTRPMMPEWMFYDFGSSKRREMTVGSSLGFTPGGKAPT